ncbi:Hypothetical predicted protein [Scomber scombrus]|uniref:Uncharacterized protein n=1 Tax=Scomber scombrus TaxID=13677 RepID=A0AAV1N7S8_SCOSC
MALSQEIEQLKTKLQKVNSMDAGNVTIVKKVSTSKMEEPDLNLEEKYSVEYRKLANDLKSEDALSTNPGAQPSVSKRFSDSASQKLNTLEKSIENMANKSLAERKETYSLQQEMEELLQRERDLKDQSDSVRDFESMEALCQELMELKVSQKTISLKGKLFQPD